MKRDTIYAGRLERLDVDDTYDGINEAVLMLPTVAEQLTTRDEDVLLDVLRQAVATAHRESRPRYAARIRALAKRLGVEVE